MVVIRGLAEAWAKGEWLRLGTDVGGLQGPVALVGFSLIALLSEHRVGHQAQ